MIKTFSKSLRLKPFLPLLRPVSNFNFSRFNNQELLIQNNSIKKLRLSKIKQLDVGKNYFANCNPRSRNYLFVLLDAYASNLSDSELYGFQDALDIFYLNEKNSKPLSSYSIADLDLDIVTIQHLSLLNIINRVVTMFSSKENMKFDKEVTKMNELPKDQRCKAKYVFTSHPTQPNSIDMLVAINNILKGLEQKDNVYLTSWMKILIDSNANRTFEKPTYIQESVNYHHMCLTSYIQALEGIYDKGLTSLEDFWELPGTWLTFDFDNHPEMKNGIMSYTHSQTIQITINQYINIISDTLTVDLTAFCKLLGMFNRVLDYARNLENISEKFILGEINKETFFNSFEKFNLYKLEKEIEDELENLCKERPNTNKQIRKLSHKILSIFKVFRIVGVRGQIRLAGEDVLGSDPENQKPIIKDIFDEVSLLQTNYAAVDMIIIANYQLNSQYEVLNDILSKHHIGNVEVVPLLETFSSINETESSITMLASSDTRQRDGMLLTELRNFKEFEANPEKVIYMGQGNTAERGGGPPTLLIQKIKALTVAHKKRHIRTVQGHFFVSEFASKELAMTFLMRNSSLLNSSEFFEPSSEYLDFLQELDNTIGYEQRKLQKTKEFNDFYTKNPIIRTLVESFNYAGSRELSKPFTNVKNQRAIVQAYVNSDRNSFTHPELSFWDRISEKQIQQIAKYYYENNPHITYLLYNYMYMLVRFDLQFGQEYVGLDSNSKIMQLYKSGSEALRKICFDCGLNSNAYPIRKMLYQHVGLHSTSNETEYNRRFCYLRLMTQIQNFQVKKYNTEQVINEKSPEAVNTLRKVRYIQSMLANVTSFTGKG